MAEMKEAGRMTESLRCMLTEAEMAEKARELSKLIAERSALKEKRKQTHAVFTEQIEGVDAEIEAIGETAGYEWEMRMIETRVVHDYDAGLVRFIRCDTNEESREPRPLTDHERQMGLSFDSPNEDGAESERLAGLLEWEEERDDATLQRDWVAESCLGPRYCISLLANGAFTLGCASALYLNPEDSERMFGSLPEAKRFCELTEEQHRNNAAKAEQRAEAAFEAEVSKPKKGRKAKAAAAVAGDA